MVGGRSTKGMGHGNRVRRVSGSACVGWAAGADLEVGEVGIPGGVGGVVRDVQYPGGSRGHCARKGVGMGVSAYGLVGFHGLSYMGMDYGIE